MSLPINTSTDAYDAQRRALEASGDLSQSIDRLSSTDADGNLSLSATLQDQVDTADQSQASAQNAVSLVQTAEGSLDQVHALLHRLRSLAAAVNSGTLSPQDEAAAQAQAQALASEVEQIASQSSSGGIAPLGQSTTVTFQIGSDESIGVATISLGQLVAPSTFDLDGGSASQVDAALEAVSSVSDRFAAIENLLQQAIQGASVAGENAGAATSQVGDVDNAAELAKLIAGQIVAQPDASASAQASSNPRTVLGLLGD